MDATDWERRFEDSVARERALAIDLLDAARALTGAFRPAGAEPVDAASCFAEKVAAWRQAVDAVAALAESRLERT